MSDGYQIKQLPKVTSERLTSGARNVGVFYKYDDAVELCKCYQHYKEAHLIWGGEKRIECSQDMSCIRYKTSSYQ